MPQPCTVYRKKVKKKEKKKKKRKKMKRRKNKVMKRGKKVKKEKKHLATCHIIRATTVSMHKQQCILMTPSNCL